MISPKEKLIMNDKNKSEDKFTRNLVILLYEALRKTEQDLSETYHLFPKHGYKIANQDTVSKIADAFWEIPERWTNEEFENNVLTEPNILKKENREENEDDYNQRRFTTKQQRKISKIRTLKQSNSQGSVSPNNHRDS